MTFKEEAAKMGLCPEEEQNCFGQLCFEKLLIKNSLYCLVFLLPIKPGGFYFTLFLSREEHLVLLLLEFLDILLGFFS